MTRNILPLIARAGKLLPVILLALALLPGLLPAGEKVYRDWTKADLVDAAAIHLSRVKKPRQPHVRYVDLSAVAPADRQSRLRVLGFVVNSLSRSDIITPARAVPGTEGALAWIDLGDYRIDPRAFDRLGELGSGPAPFPEPYFHAVSVEVTAGVEKVEEVKEWEPRTDGYGRRYYVEVVRVRKRLAPGHKKKVVALGPHLNKATALGLATLAQSNFPIFEYRWLAAFALVEPRYHELLGLDDTEASAQKLAGVNLKADNDEGATLRGAVMFSEVGLHNRFLDRHTSRRKNGRGSYQRSLDFKTSVKLQDALKDLDNQKADAFEVIFTLFNGLPAFQVYDAKQRRLDKADAGIAVARRLRFRDPQVYAAITCLGCHLPDSGWIYVDDEVRDLSKKPITLLADAFDREKKGRGDRIRQKYLQDDYNDLLAEDRKVVAAAVARATGGLTPAQVARLLVEDVRGYLDDPVTVERLAWELGYPQEDVLAAMQTAGVDPVFVVMRAGRKGRRDQVEAGFAQLATILYEKGKK